MSEILDLEPQQYERQYWEDDVPLNDVRQSVLRRFVYFGVALFMLFVLAGAFIKFPDQVELPFVLKSQKVENIYRFPYPVYLLKKFVSSGNNLPKGTPMVTITSPEIVAMINNYEAAVENSSNFRLQKPVSLQKQRTIFQLAIEKDALKITSLQKDLKSLENIWKSNNERLAFNDKDAEKNLERNKQLFTGKVISRKELEEFEVKKVTTTDASQTAQQQYEKEKAGLLSVIHQYQLDIVSLQQELDKLHADTKYDSVQLNNQVQLAYNKIKNSFGDVIIESGSLTLKAPENSVVSFVFEGEKEITSGAILLKTSTANPTLYAYIASPASLVGKLQQAKNVYLKVASFPSYEWGSMVAHITNVSLTPDEKGVFNVEVAIDDQRKLKNRLQAGMDGNAAIVLQEKTFFQYFFRDMKKAYAVGFPEN